MKLYIVNYKIIISKCNKPYVESNLQTATNYQAIIFIISLLYTLYNIVFHYNNVLH